MTDLPVLSVASEVYPLVKTGGLADVAGALPLALAAEGVAVRSLVPGYPAVLAALEGAAEPVHAFAAFAGGGAARLLADMSIVIRDGDGGMRLSGSAGTGGGGSVVCCWYLSRRPPVLMRFMSFHHRPPGESSSSFGRALPIRVAYPSSWGDALLFGPGLYLTGDGLPLRS